MTTTPRLRDGLSPEQADAVYDVLVALFGVRDDPDSRADFAHHQTARFCPEYRVGGLGGFGGKFWRGHGRRADGTWGEQWYVNAYPEDTTVQVRDAILDVNAALAKVQGA